MICLNCATYWFEYSGTYSGTWSGTGTYSGTSSGTSSGLVRREFRSWAMLQTRACSEIRSGACSGILKERDVLGLNVLIHLGTKGGKWGTIWSNEKPRNYNCSYFWNSIFGSLLSKAFRCIQLLHFNPGAYRNPERISGIRLFPLELNLWCKYFCDKYRQPRCRL